LKDLVQLIRDNPGAVFIIDNDCWTMHRVHPDLCPRDLDDDAEERWNEENELVSSFDRLLPLGDGGYGSGSTYGGDVLQALARIVGVRVESV
jgi:hypothetical protein